MAYTKTIYYNLYIWEHNFEHSMDGENVIGTYCSSDCFKLITNGPKLSEADINKIFNGSYDINKYILYATTTKKSNEKFLFNPSYITQSFVINLYNSHKNLQKAKIIKSSKYIYSHYNKLDEYDSFSTPTKAKPQTKSSYDSYFNPKPNPDMLWLYDSLACNKFPARSQKIKGLKQASSYLREVTSSKSIDSGYSVSYNEDLTITHSVNNNGSGCYYNGKRKTKEEILDLLIGKFVRPCPQTPNHGGGVDSRTIHNIEEGEKIINEIIEAGEIPEMIVMDKVNCDYSGVICPDRLTFGSSNDGATSGNNALEIALNLPVEGKEEFRKRFWNNKVQWPFAEVLYEEGVNPILVQLRSGPEVDEIDDSGKVVVKKVKVVEVYVVDGDMSLIAWEKESKKLRERVIELNKDNVDVGNNSYIENTIAVWHSGGALCSHFGVHCREFKPTMPYLTSSIAPKIGEVIEMGLKKQPNIDKIKEGLLIGLNENESVIELDKNGGRNKVKEDLKNFLASLHIYTIADLGDETTAKWIGYSWGIGARIISALPLGEARHNVKLTNRLNKVLGKKVEEKIDIKKEEEKKEEITWNKEKAKNHNATYIMLLIQNKKLDAIKVYKAANNCLLKEAKDAIDKITEDIELNIPLPKYPSSYEAVDNSDYIIVSVRDIVYKNAWKLPLEKLLLGLIESYDGFLTESWGSSFGGQKWAACTLSLIEVFGNFDKFIDNPNEEHLSNIISGINMMINLAHNGGGFSWLDKLISKSDFDNASLLPHFLVSPRRGFEAKKINIGGKFSIKLKGIKTIETLKVVKDLEKIIEENKLKEEKAKKELEEDSKKILEYEKKSLEDKKEIDSSIYLYTTQHNIKNSINVDKVIACQYYLSDNIAHIQIACDPSLFNGVKSYGISYDIVINNSITLELLQDKLDNQKSKLESFASKGTFKYAYLELYKSYSKDNKYKHKIVLKLQNKFNTEVYGIVYDIQFYKILGTILGESF